MDDVLDCVRSLFVCRNVYGHLSGVVPVLLRDQGDHCAVAAFAGDKGQLHAVPEICASDAYTA